MSDALKISIIIPTLNEAQRIETTLGCLELKGVEEIIVADGGSADETVELARARGATIIQSPPGRAKQMNAGAAIASGDALLFLHADTTLPRDFVNHIKHELRNLGVVGGAFSLGIDSPGVSLRVVEKFANIRARHLKLPYGDQAIFVRRDTFWDLRGFKEMPILEDVELVRRLRKKGSIAISPAEVKTSARRWKRHGVIKTTIVNQYIMAAYSLGMPTDRLAKLYYR